MIGIRQEKKFSIVTGTTTYHRKAKYKKTAVMGIKLQCNKTVKGYGLLFEWGTAV
jgi:hypothetical protein